MDDEGAQHVADLEHELAALRPRLAHEQQGLESTRVRLEEFGRHYARTIGARLEQLEALRTDRPLASRISDAARLEPEMAGRPSADDELQRLYRQTAHRVHPDHAQDHDERVLRTKVMAAFNAAREAQDLDRARQLLEDWEIRPQAIVRDSNAARAAHLVRTIERARGRLVAIAEEHDRLRRSNLYVLMGLVEAQRRSGVDMLAETAADLDEQLAVARAEAAAPLPVADTSVPTVTSTGPAAAEPAAAPAPSSRTGPAGFVWATGAIAGLFLIGAVAASILAADRTAVVLLPSTGDRPTSAPSARPAIVTPTPLAYRVIDRTVSGSSRSMATVRIVVDGTGSSAEAISTLASAARRELRSSQAVVVYAYRRVAETLGPFTVGRAYLSADGRGWSGDGRTEDGLDDGGIVGAVVTAVGGSIDVMPFRVSR